MQPSSTYSNDGLMLKVEILFSVLRKERFELTADDYSNLLFVASRLQARTLQEIAGKLCPIVATNESEQQRFYEIVRKVDGKSIAEIEDFVQAVPPAVAPVDPRVEEKRKRVKWLRVAAVSAIVVAAALALWWSTRPAPVISLIHHGSISAYMTVKKGDTLHLDAGSYIPAEADSAKLDFTWQFGDSTTGKGLRTRHVYTREGDFIVQVEARSGHYTIKDPRDSIFVHVCKDLPKIDLTTFSAPVGIGDTVRILATGQGNGRKYEWRVDDSIALTTTVPHITRIFSREGYHIITCTAIAAGQGCDGNASTRIEVRDAKKSYTVKVTGSRLMPTQDMQIKPWAPWLIWGLALLGSSLLWVSKKAGRRPELLPEKGGARKKVWEVPFPATDINIIRPGKMLYKMMHLMRRRSDEEICQLDILMTLQRTIRNQGLSDLVFTPRKRFQEYILLIDLAAPNGAFRHLSDYLGRIMSKMDIRISVYYFDRQFNFYRSQLSTRITPEQLINIHPNALPILLGDGDNLFYSLLPVIKEKLLRFFNAWADKAIITPLPRSSWGQREKVLARHFLISEAGEEELLRLIGKLHLAPEEQTETRTIPDIPDDVPGIRTIEDAFHYLGDRPFMVQWLCALALYPKFRWELLPVFGEILAKLYKDEQGVSYENVLRLSRIPWLAQGEIPVHVRLELLKDLAVPNEIALRTGLLKMLTHARQAGSGFFYDNELEDQLVINKFILYGHRPDLFPEYKEEATAFRKMWEKGQLLDPSLRLYLENAEKRKWSTPLRLQDPLTTVSLKKYFDGGRQLYSWRSIYRLMLTVLLFLSAYGLSRYLEQASMAPNQFASVFFTSDPSQLVDIRYRLVKNTDSCNIGDSTFVEDLTGAFVTGSSSYRISYDTIMHTISAKVPYALVAGSPRPVTLTMDSGNPSYVENEIAIDTLFTNGTITFRCAKNPPPPPDSPKAPVPLNFPDSLNEIWSGAGNRLISIDSRKNVIYYSVTDPGTFGTYHIDSTLRMPDGTYRVITRTTRQGYKLFAFRNIRLQSFDLAVCQDFAANRQELLNRDCGVYNPMSWYYESDARKIFYPANARRATLAPGERAKLRSVTGSSQMTITHYEGIHGIGNNLSGPVLSSGGVPWRSGGLIGIVNPSPFQRDYDLIGLPAQYRILWVDDHTENNQAEIDSFRKANIQVDLALTNEEGYKMLNKNSYGYIITDIGRNNPEPCVTDSSRAGVEFVQKVNFPKRYLIVCAPAATIDRNRKELLGAGMPNGNLNSDKPALLRMVLAGISQANSAKYPQKECQDAPNPAQQNPVQQYPARKNPALQSAVPQNPVQQTPVKKIMYDTIRNTLVGYKSAVGLVTGKVYVNIPLKKYNIDLTLIGSPKGIDVSFSYVVTDPACPKVAGKVPMSAGETKEFFTACGTTLTIKLLSVRSGVAYFDAYIKRYN